MSEDNAGIVAFQIDPLMTRAHLLDRVDGVFRFVARAETLTTVRGEGADIRVGIAEVTRLLEERTGRRLAGATGHRVAGDNSEIREFRCAIVDVPFRVAIVGLGAAPPIEAARAGTLAAECLVSAE